MYGKMSRCAKIVTAVFLIIACGICLSRLFNILWVTLNSSDLNEIDTLLRDTQLYHYKQAFLEGGM